MDEPIVLIVKAPNQQIEDQTIHCGLDWTVKRLKEHLSEVYPSKPRSEDQKLIYSGQLLTDSTTLKDILRVYEGLETHTVHLVCSPSKESLRAASTSIKKPTPMATPQPAPQEQTTNGATTTTTGDGLRHRGGPVYNSPPQSWPFTFVQPPAGAPGWPMVGTYDSASVAQQMAWMQQAYAQYMTQYMQLMTSGNIPLGMQMPPTMNPVPPAPHPAPLGEEPVAANEPVPNEEDELRGNRDWLDWFYIMSRMLVLFSIVYFYSSPVRFFVVSTLAIIMYLYHVGFFRAVQRLDQQEEAAVTPPPTPDTPEGPEAPATPPPPPPPPSALAITWAAFSSFFLSLIPDQPNVL